jgi:hypothetical protein
MARFQLEIAIALAISATASFLILVFGGLKEGKIQLPTHYHEEEQSGPDPFDVATAEDFLEGYPIDETSFYKKVRYWHTHYFGIILTSVSATDTERPPVFVVNCSLVFTVSAARFVCC